MVDENYKVILSALISSRRLFLQYKQSNNNALTPYIKLHSSNASGWSIDVQTTGLQDVASSMLQKKILINEFPPLGDVGGGYSSPIDAFILPYTSHAEILVNRSKNYCWKRFLVAKELCHLMMQIPSNCTSLVASDIENLISEILNSAPISSPALQAEYVAYIAAIELLFPSEFIASAQKTLNSGGQVLDVAMAYKIPRVIVEFRLQNKNIVELFNTVYAETKFKHLAFSPVL